MSFLESALTTSGITADPEAILGECTRAHAFDVRRVPLSRLPRWHMGRDALRHETGRFFSIEGIEVRSNFGPTARWCQPIIQQPEIGMLGFLTQRIGGVLHLLAQAKMEPGNRVMVQYSPTVQATPSNYTRVHGGRETPYLDYFMEPSRRGVRVDLLQSEQGSRYFRKRNRNLVVEVPPHIEVPLLADFHWLTLGQLHVLLAAGNRVNMNARTVLGCIPYDEPARPLTTDARFRRAVLASRLPAPQDDEALHTTLSWLIDRKQELALEVRRVPLAEVEGWTFDDDSIRHESGRFFQVIGLDVRAQSREVGSWSQPAIEPIHHGHVGLLCQERAGELQVLVHARVEAGFIDRVELGPTFQFSPANYSDPAHHPPFAQFVTAPAAWVRLRAAQSEDGGRFYHDETEHIIIELPDDIVVDVPTNFRWLRLSVLQRLLRCGYHLNIEARSLLACLA